MFELVRNACSPYSTTSEHIQKLKVVFLLFSSGLPQLMVEMSRKDRKSIPVAVLNIHLIDLACVAILLAGMIIELLSILWINWLTMALEQTKLPASAISVCSTTPVIPTATTTMGVSTASRIRHGRWSSPLRSLAPVWQRCWRI